MISSSQSIVSFLFDPGSRALLDELRSTLTVEAITLVFIVTAPPVAAPS